MKHARSYRKRKENVSSGWILRDYGPATEVYLCFVEVPANQIRYTVRSWDLLEGEQVFFIYYWSDRHLIFDMKNSRSHLAGIDDGKLKSYHEN